MNGKGRMVFIAPIEIRYISHFLYSHNYILRERVLEEFGICRDGRCEDLQDV